MYKAITLFADGVDGGYVYRTGDTYPRKGYTPTPERIKELLSSDNKRGIALIVEVKEDKPAPAKVEETEKPKKEKAEPKKAETKKATKKTAKKK